MYAAPSLRSECAGARPRIAGKKNIYAGSFQKKIFLHR